ncbi:hypothetical protein BRC97_07550 [Halobacteriales archaeon QS_6_71_20]|nr:MAG: hypothetical protein BRC97_07550 [Halobacteriales archaeon QS_6_71_20]
MSDTADEPSGDDSEFDKEAEREKLREKFARDERKRESTRRMSELLLAGATMTNAHCDACGSPIFRQNGREFCPECDAAEGDGATGTDADATTADAGAAGGPDAADAPATSDATTADADPVDAPATDARTTATPSRTTGTNDGAPQPPQGGRRAPQTSDVDSRGTDEPMSDPAADRRSGRPAGGLAANAAASGHADPPRPAEPSRPGTAAGDDVDAAREALATALRRHAEAGAEASDPRVAADHLDAAREAAEALSALRR